MKYFNLGLSLLLTVFVYQQINFIYQMKKQILTLEESNIQLHQTILENQFENQNKLASFSIDLSILEEEVQQFNENKIDKIDINSLPSRENLDDAWAGGYFGDGKIVCLLSISTCQHELGHANDEFLGRPSQTVEFRADVKLFEAQCDAKTITSVFCYVVWYAPGIGDNALLRITLENGDITEWGSYSELYATIFARIHTHLKNVPAPLYKYFRFHIDTVRERYFPNDVVISSNIKTYKTLWKTK